MQNFKGINFKGTFRVYQQRVLDVADKHLKDGKIHIVAAPGSGKTILGCELIRRLNQPCIIFSPTVTIKEQWGSRFASWFLNGEEQYNELVSYDLSDIKLINTVTYQALYSAMEKVAVDGDEESFDYSDIDIFKLIKEKKIKTICLDEAHHLKNEWQRSLEKLLQGLDKKIKIIALTATPPYDSSESEWQRYINVCGEIDEEIFVPELVKQNTLCPHQDFVYFSLPNENELNEYEEYTKNAQIAVSEIIQLDSFKFIFDQFVSKYDQYFNELYAFEQELISLFVLFEYAGFNIDKKLLKIFAGQETLPEYNLKHADKAIGFLMEIKFIADSIKNEIKEILKKYKLIERGKVSIYLNNKIKKSLSASMSKLESISKIVKLESESLKEKLRMLILTDYIRQDSTKNINTDKPFKCISIVSIFEVLRREHGDLRLGAISGSVVILPTDVKDKLITDLKLTVKDFSSKIIPDTNYSYFSFKGGNKNKVKYVSILFEKGFINVLVGTKSLLGEGWDSPCINSLVLASFVGSFVLSNQMRGRAIRIYSDEPDKCSNIWHLATVEPELNNDNKKQIKKSEEAKSYDFDTLSRRFECFVGPNYKTGEIENGIKRVVQIKPTFDKEKIDSINTKTEELSKDRENTRNQWLGGIKNNTELCVETEIPKSKRLPSFTLFGTLLLALMLVTEVLLWINILTKTNGFWKILLSILLLYISIYVIRYFIILSFKVIRHLTPKNSIKTLSTCVMKTLCDLNEINKNCKLHVVNNKENNCIGVSILNASLHEQNVFHDCLTELFSFNNKPRYILVYVGGAGVRDYYRSLICPRLFGENKKSVNIFVGYLKKYSTKFEGIYIKSGDTMKPVINCRNESYIFKTGEKITKKQKLIQ